MRAARLSDRSVYASASVGLVACPFCREMFEEGEASTCPVCGMALTSITKLPRPTYDISEDGVPIEPEREPLPITYMGRGKGVLALLGAAGLVLFFLPWAKVTLPDIFDLSGFELARRRGWCW